VRRGRHRGGPRALALAALVVGAALALSACSSTAQGQSLAREACVHVNRSIADYLLAAKTSTVPAAAAHLEDEADQQLRAALPLAAAANSDDGTWNALMTAISESGTIDEAHLIPSLHAQCVLADTNQNVNPQAPSPGNTGDSGSSGSSGNSGNSGTSGASHAARTSTTVPQNVNPEPASPAG
jgi:uncharacterized membrane protein YgcG